MRGRTLSPVTDWLSLTRPVVATRVGLTACASAYLAGAGAPEVGLSALSGAALAAGLYTLDDLFDVEADRFNHPERPLPGERLAAGPVRRAGMGLLCRSALLAWLANRAGRSPHLSVLVVRAMLTVAAFTLPVPALFGFGSVYLIGSLLISAYLLIYAGMVGHRQTRRLHKLLNWVMVGMMLVAVLDHWTAHDHATAGCRRRGARVMRADFPERWGSDEPSRGAVSP